MLSKKHSITDLFCCFLIFLSTFFQPASASLIKNSLFKPSIFSNQGGLNGSPPSSDFHFVITLPLGTISIPSFRIRSLNSMNSYVPSGILVALEAGDFFLDVTDADSNVRVTDDEFFVYYEGFNEGYTNICIYLFAESLDDPESRSNYHESAFEIRIPADNNNLRDDLVYVLRENVQINGGHNQGTVVPESTQTTILHTTIPSVSASSISSISTTLPSFIIMVSMDNVAPSSTTSTISGTPVSISQESFADAVHARSVSQVRFSGDAELNNLDHLPGFPNYNYNYNYMFSFKNKLFDMV